MASGLLIAQDTDVNTHTLLTVLQFPSKSSPKMILRKSGEERAKVTANQEQVCCRSHKVEGVQAVGRDAFIVTQV